MRPDLRRIVRASLRTGGEPLQRSWRGPSLRPRQLVLVCDVSGSMAPYARMLLQYLQASVTARRRVEAFAFGTRLTRITQELTGRDPDRALARASAAVLDIAGGTRIGAALAELNRAARACGWGGAPGGDPVRRLGPRRPRIVWRTRWHGFTAPRTASYGSIRSRHTRPTNRSRAGCALRYRTPTSFCPATL